MLAKSTLYAIIVSQDSFLGQQIVNIIQKMANINGTEEVYLDKKS